MDRGEAGHLLAYFHCLDSSQFANSLALLFYIALPKDNGKPRQEKEGKRRHIGIDTPSQKKESPLTGVRGDNPPTPGRSAPDRESMLSLAEHLLLAREKASVLEPRGTPP